MRGFGWLKRVEPEADALERDNTITGTEVSIQPAITAFWESLSSGVPMSPRLVERVWVANRCIQLNAQQVASMPLRWFGNGNQPAWVANPDPSWYPNGIGDAVFAAVWSMYAWGDAFLYIVDRYADGLPSAWTVLDPSAVSVHLVKGSRVYRNGQFQLDADRVVQISRDPRGGLRGTSALRAYASHAWGIIAGGETGRAMVGAGGSVPNAVIKSQRKLTGEQARMIQDQWVAARARVGAGVPAILPPDLDFTPLAFSPADLLLLDAQQFDARVVASAFGVPPYMLNLPLEGGLTYQNPATLFEQWWRAELRPAAMRVSRALSANMLPRGSWVEFDARAVLAPTFEQLVAAWTSLHKEGVVSTDELRAAVLHLPPMEEGDALEQLTQPPSAGATPAQQNGVPANVQELRPAVMA